MVRRFLRVALAAALFVPVLAAAAPGNPGAAPAPQGSGVTRAELARVLAAHGMTVRDATQDDTDPWLRARTPKGTDFYVNFYDCSGTGSSQRCSNLQFLAQWDLGKQANAATAMQYNQRFVFGRAYMSKDGKLFMFDYSINIKDGVSPANLKRHVDNWLRVLDDVRSLLKA
jgi:hypothetical protein